MIRAACLALLVLPQVAVAQDWTSNLRVTGAVTANYKDSGTQLFVGVAGDGAWNGSEIYQSAPATDDVSCAAAREFEIDHYVGYGEDYVLQVLITIVRNGDGTWTGLDPDIYLDTIDGLSLAGFDGVAKIQSLSCVDSTVTVSFSFRGDAVSEDSKPLTAKISGSSTVTLPIYPYSNY